MNIFGNNNIQSGSNIVINGKYISGKSISIKDNKVIVDGLEVKPEQLEDTKNVHIEVKGDITAIEIYGKGNITCNNVGSIQLDSGKISCKDIGGNLGIVNGNVFCGNITGHVDSVSGDINASSIGGDVETVSGNITVK